MTAEKERTRVGKFIRGPIVKNVLGPLVRGVVQIGSLGTLTPIVEIASNFMKPKTMTATSVAGDVIEVIKPNKHSWISIAFKSVLAIAVVLDVILNKGENILSIANALGVLSAEVPEVSPVQ